ncbi:MAG: DNA-3-methyladenine glycosylase 2 family protein [Planctomycetaceae bacterium]|nr:MAG: DNA-3-methyladenine glycosylase 2 family protein [Planctomycetaceae bacterium]
MAWNPADVERAIIHLKRSDRVLGRVIDTVGPFALKLERNRFQMLVWSILSQQISGKAARSIRRRLVELIAPDRVSPENLATLSIGELRSAGVSPQKARYIHDLSAKVAEGTVRLPRVARMSDDEVIAELVQVKGIGVWTAQMFLMFSLGRLDVFPHDDLGIRTALRNLYGLKDLPDRTRSHELAAPWRPYATVASWYCWRSLDLKND